jgi:hypothetical protein
MFSFFYHYFVYFHNFNHAIIAIFKKKFNSPHQENVQSKGSLCICPFFSIYLWVALFATAYRICNFFENVQ